MVALTALAIGTALANGVGSYLSARSDRQFEEKRLRAQVAEAEKDRELQRLLSEQGIEFQTGENQKNRDAQLDLVLRQFGFQEAESAKDRAANRDALIRQLTARGEEGRLGLAERRLDKQHGLDVDSARRKGRRASVLRGIQAASLGTTMVRNGAPARFAGPKIPDAPTAGEVTAEAATLPRSPALAPGTLR